eukprot:3118749-Amphidinium_carterae.1
MAKAGIAHWFRSNHASCDQHLIIILQLSPTERTLSGVLSGWGWFVSSSLIIAARPALVQVIRVLLNGPRRSGRCYETMRALAC